jgi:RNA polymerase sigma-70 factor (ECF subfamily)
MPIGMGRCRCRALLRDCDSGHNVVPMSEREADADAPLVARMRDGDVAAFDTLYHRYVERLYAFAFSYVRDGDVAEEVVQDVLCAMWERRAAWAPVGTLRAYLFSAVRYRALDVLRRQRDRQRLLDIERDDDVLAATAMSSDVEANDVAASVQRAIAALPESRRRVLLLRWIDGLSYVDIAQVVGSSVKAVENQLNRTLKQLRTLLGDLER